MNLIVTSYNYKIFRNFYFLLVDFNIYYKICFKTNPIIDFKINELNMLYYHMPKILIDLN